MLSVYLAMTPVLLTLTEPYADNTVGSLVSVLLAVHLFAHDYFPADPGPGCEASPSVVSLNAGVVATMLLASRLQSVLTAFFAISAGLAVVYGVPRLRARMWCQQPRAACHVFTALALASTGAEAVILLRWQERDKDPDGGWAMAVAATYVAGLFTLWVGCPFLYAYLHRFKIVLTGCVGSRLVRW
jgi:hypothetical protein